MILIVKRTGETTEIIPVAQGDVRPTEIQSIIALGYSAWTASRGRGLKMGEK